MRNEIFKFLLVEYTTNRLIFQKYLRTLFAGLKKTLQELKKAGPKARFIEIPRAELGLEAVGSSKVNVEHILFQCK